MSCQLAQFLFFYFAKRMVVKYCCVHVFLCATLLAHPLVMSEMASVTWVTYLEIVIWVSNHNLILYQGYAMMSMDFFVYNVEIM